jgi:hypothetical protein
MLTVQQYIDSLSEDRREAILRVRKMVKANLQPGYEEGIGYGMITWFVPHSLYPAGYHCDPKLPLPFISLASQKNYMSLYMFCLYTDPENAEQFYKNYEATGKKIEKGKSTITFKKPEDLALELIGEQISAITVEKYLANYEIRKPKKKKK